jgi:3-(3-hydroxy-phenyl)propionate hydroxylase
MTEPNFSDIIVVGAGPAGLVCAAGLAKAGLHVTVLEAEPEIPSNLRGSTFHPSTLDMLERSFGAAKPLIERGLVAPTVQYRRHRVGKIAEFDFRDIAHLTEHPFRLQAEQFKLCLILRDYLEQFSNVSLEFGKPVTSASQSDTGAEVRVADSPAPLQCRYLVGADGANSVVRRAANIEFDGFTWPERFLVVSTPFDFASSIKDLASVSYFADAEEWYFLLQIPNRLWRVMFPVSANEQDDDILSDARIQQRLQRVHARTEPYEVVHKTLYNVHQRVAKTYHQGRILLTGDAAHINNPLGGMGMNGGIHDSFNLIDKLVEVCKGNTPEEAFNSYSNERREIALAYVQELSIRNKLDLEASDPETQRAFEQRLRSAAENLGTRQQLLTRLAMLKTQA